MTLKKFAAAILAGTVLAAAPLAGALAQDKPQIAVLLFSRGFEFMVALDQGAQAEAEKLGVDITVLDGQSNSEVQTRQIEDLLVSGVDAIVISPANSEEIVPAVRKANEANVPVVAVDGVVGEGGAVVSYVGFDNAAGGATAADYLAGLGNITEVLELQGALGAYHAQKRGGGFNDAAKGKFEVLSRPAEWLAENAQAITADVLTANPNVNGIFTHNDEMIRGVLAGLRQIDKAAKVGEEGHVVIVGIDGTPLALQRIRDGEQDATVNQDPFEMGALAVRAAVAATKGESVPPQQLLPATLVTKENVDDPALWGNRFKP